MIGRSKESASDTASTENAMVEFAKKYEFDNIVLIQATSPLLTWEDLSGGFQEFNTHGTDSVLSVVRQKRFQWEMNANNFVNPVNYDVFCRPRRQDFDGFLVENGAFYIITYWIYWKIWFLGSSRWYISMRLFQQKACI